MWKKALYMSMTALIINSPAMAIEIPAEPESTFNYKATAYSSNVFNRILEAHGLSLMAESAVEIPVTYARVNGEDVIFNDLSIAYSPEDYHKIFTAYGLELSAEKASTMTVKSYARVVNDEVVFGDTVSIAYSSLEWQDILSAYAQIETKEEVVEVAVAEYDSDGDGVVDSRDACPDTPKGAEINERGCWEYSGMVFGLNSAVIMPEYHEMLNGTKKVFDSNPGLKIVVEGHTCDIGAARYNQKISEYRAQAVVNYLVKEVGVDADALQWVGFGEDKPAYSNATEEGRAKNRRVQFKRLK